MPKPIPPSFYSEVAQKVVRNYRKHKRDLPWRKRKDAYGVWISEIMLQQTRVAAVIPYYQRWLKDFPTIETLAAAQLDQVLSHWSGLGYYSRARNIHKSAQVIVQQYKGQLPKTAKELRTLPGIGRYTAGAISSIAYGQKEALVDGNVARLLARVFLIEEDIKSTLAIKKLWQHCENMVPSSAPGDFNQGLMELGALTCLPKKPKCSQCPLHKCCLAISSNRVEDLPLVQKRTKDLDKKLLESDAIFLTRRGKILLGHRKTSGLFGGLWEFPQATSQRELKELTGLPLHFYHSTPSYIHKQILTHRRLLIKVWAAKATGRTKLQGTSPYQSLAWYAPTALLSLGLSSATTKILSHRKEIEYENKE